ncbi:MAG: hypothetical protein MI919_17220 [Holophagales bacterium]|nr:hypothetical protein [Holophagales bacterium]
MELALYTAALLTFAIGLAHSYLGERYLLIRLFRRENLPRVLGSTDFTKRTLRFAWHLTTVAWLGLAAILILLANPPIAPDRIGLVLSITFFVHFAVALVASRGRHLSWIVFLAIALLAYLATAP